MSESNELTPEQRAELLSRVEYLGEGQADEGSRETESAKVIDRRNCLSALSKVSQIENVEYASNQQGCRP